MAIYVLTGLPLTESTANHLYLANNNKVEHIDCNDVALTYSPRLIADVLDRTQPAVSQEHTFMTMELAIRAQMLAEGQTDSESNRVVRS